MKRKLIFDKNNPEAKSINNLCLITSSVFNQVSFGGEGNILNVVFNDLEKKINGNELYSKYTTLDRLGLISSIPFSEYGLDNFFENRVFIDKGISFFKSLEKFSTSQENNYFECYPLNFCKEAYCFSDEIVQAVISLGEYIKVYNLNKEIYKIPENPNPLDKEYYKKCKDFKDELFQQPLITNLEICRILNNHEEKMVTWLRDNNKPPLYDDQPIRHCLYEFFPDFLHNQKRELKRWNNILNCSDAYYESVDALKVLENLSDEFKNVKNLTDIFDSYSTKYNRYLTILNLIKPKNEKKTNLQNSSITLMNEMFKYQKEQNNYLAKAFAFWAQEQVRKGPSSTNKLDEKRFNACENFKINIKKTD